MISIRNDNVGRHSGSFDVDMRCRSIVLEMRREVRGILSIIDVFLTRSGPNRAAAPPSQPIQ
jgi:hypothetical protein